MWLLGTVAATLFVVTFLFRFSVIDFTNDHFVHLSRGQQIVFGEWPVRDFFDPGLPLQYVASAIALYAGGHNLLGEAVVTIGFIALGAALTFTAAALVTRSMALGLVAAVIAIGTMPRLYSYPKAFLFSLALVCACAWLQQRTRGRLAVLAIVTAVAFLFRHDHGVYIGLFSTVLIGGASWGAFSRGVREWLLYSAMVAVLLLPYALFVESSVGLWRYAQGISPQAREITTARVNPLSFALDRSKPLFSIEALPPRRISVRWVEGLAEDTRLRLEVRYGLTAPVPDQPPTWSYGIANESEGNIRALVSDPQVADTHGIDRVAGRLEADSSWWERLMRRVPVLGTRIHLGIFTDENALAWLYYTTLLAPLAAALLLIGGALRRTLPLPEGALVAAAAVLCAVIGQSLVRSAPQVRLPDVAGPVGVLFVWTMMQIGGRHSPARPRGPAPPRRVRRLAAAALILATVWSAARVGRGDELFAASGLVDRPAAITQRLADVAAELRRRPIETYAPPGSTGLRALTRYVYDCTAPEDRVLVAWFDPQVFFYAERAFAGGQVYLDPGWHDSDADQRLTVERLERERVPVVLVRSEVERLVWDRFHLVRDYVRGRYREAARSTFGSDQEYAVLIDARRTPSGTYAPLGLPCFSG